MTSGCMLEHGYTEDHARMLQDLTQTESQAWMENMCKAQAEQVITFVHPNASAWFTTLLPSLHSVQLIVACTAFKQVALWASATVCLQLLMHVWSLHWCQYFILDNCNCLSNTPIPILHTMRCVSATTDYVGGCRAPKRMGSVLTKIRGVLL